MFTVEQANQIAKTWGVYWKVPCLNRYETGSEKCFPAGTLISLPDGKTLAIEEIVPAEHVAAFASGSAAGLASSPLEARPVTRLFHNVTTEWIELVWRDPATGEWRVLTSTPGHVMLTPEGKSHVDLHGSEAQDLPQGFVFRQLIDMIVPGTISSADSGHEDSNFGEPLTQVTLPPGFIQPGVRCRRWFCPDRRLIRRAVARSFPCCVAPVPVAV